MEAVLTAGGRNEFLTSYATTEIYDVAENNWSAAAQMNRARANHTATLLGNGAVLVVGGGLVVGGRTDITRRRQQNCFDYAGNPNLTTRPAQDRPPYLGCMRLIRRSRHSQWRRKIG
jgi:hypothetical protein